MIENIKSLWSQMLDETQNKAIKGLAERFKLKETYLRQNWIYKGNIPEKKQEKVITIFQNALREQWNTTKELI